MHNVVYSSPSKSTVMFLTFKDLVMIARPTKNKILVNK